ncbi:MAG: hypothetical protein ACYSUF_04275 [Planctomycetota bacterium]|jgi:hypothetical protein
MTPENERRAQAKSADPTLPELKSVSKTAIPHALKKAEKYRLLNQPWNAESICRDVLEADPDHQEAVVTLLLSLTDQFGKNLGVTVTRAQEVLPRIKDEYRRSYYGGVVCERWAKGAFEQAAPGYAVYGWFRQALDHYERAEAIRPPDNDDSILRWNAVVRILQRHGHVRPKPQDQSIATGFGDEVPFR